MPKKFNPLVPPFDYYEESNINDGVTQGQMSFWDNTLKKWTYTETSELFWDDTAKVLTFGSFPLTPSSAPTTNYQVANKKYVDDNAGGAVEGTAVLSTGEAGGTKYLREDGDGTCSWQIVSAGSQTPWTSNINADGYTLFGNDGSGETLTLGSTSHATKGKILFGTSAYDEVNNRLGIGTATPNNKLQVAGLINFNDTLYNIALGTSSLNTMSTGTNSVAIGFEALKNSNAGYNVAIGYRAGIALTSGTSNFLMGYLAGNGLVIGANNVAIGVNTLITGDVSNCLALGANSLRSTTANGNVGVGPETLRYNTSGYNSVGIGFNAGQNNTTASFNTAVGANTLRLNATGGRNVAIGDSAAFGASGGNVLYNVFIGYRAGYSVRTNANYNTIIGHESGYLLTTGANNLFLGNYAGYRQTTNSNLLIIDNQQRADTATEASNAILYGVMAAAPANQTLRINANTHIFGNVGIGTATPAQQLELTGSLRLPTTTTSTTGVIYKGANAFIHNFSHPTGGGAIPEGFNLFLGEASGNFTLGSTATSNWMGSNNLCIGRRTGRVLSTGNDNIIVGTDAGYSITTGTHNSLIGRDAGYSLSSGRYNVIYGYYAGRSATTVDNSIFIGKTAGYANTTGTRNVFIGSDCGRANVTGASNTFLGTDAGRNNTGSSNTYIGDSAAFTNSSGQYNTIMGNAAGYQITGSRNVILGYYAGYRQTATSNLLLIDSYVRANAATEQTNAILYGVMALAPADQDLYINADTFLKADNRKLFLGAGDDASIYYDGTNLNIDTDLVGASDLTIDCGTDKTVVLEESVWNDIQFNIETGRTSAANFPDWDSSFTTNTGAYKFDVNDYIDLGTNEMQHDWKEATDIYPHVHVALDGANASGGTQYAKFIIYIAYAKKDAVYAETNSTIEIAIPNGTADLTMLVEGATAQAMTGLTIGTQLNVRLKRIAATTGTEYPNHIFVTQVGIHYEIDTMGSRQTFIK